MARRPLASLFVALAAGLAFTAPAFAQMMGGGATPLATDLRKVPVGSWAEYKMTIAAGAGITVKSRWALVARDAGSNTLEMSAEGGPMGQKMLVKTVLVPEPAGAEKPVKEMVMKLGDRDPMQMPLDMPMGPTPRFEKPDPKKLVGKEQVKVAAGTFKTSHYHDTSEVGTVDIWVSDQVAPLGIVKVAMQPKPGAVGPGGQPMPPVTMELAGRGKGAKPGITKPAKPFDPSMFGPPPGVAPGGPPPSGAPPSVPAPSGAPKK